jgi:DnaJ-class molecular chaperone
MVRTMLDPYAILQVGREVSQDEIKRSYRKLAKAFHPDLHPDNPLSLRRFKDISSAYDLLSDEAKRQRYDRALAPAAADPAAPADGRFEAGLDSFFSGRGWGHRPDGSGPPRRGADIFQTLKLDFTEAALGTRKRIVVKDERAVDVIVPALTEDGQTLRLKGQGEPGSNGGLSGDVLVEIAVARHDLFTRSDLDIHMVLPVTVPEAVLGALVTVPTLYGPAQLEIPKGSNTDARLRLEGKGVTTPDGAQGDQHVVLKVVLPDPHDLEFLRLVEVWSRRYSYRVRPAAVEP